VLIEIVKNVLDLINAQGNILGAVMKCRNSRIPRYFLSEELIWKVLVGLTKWAGRGVRTISKKDVARFVHDHTCPTCGRVFLSRLELMTHHATELFGGIEVIDLREFFYDFDKLFPNNYKRHQS